MTKRLILSFPLVAGLLGCGTTPGNGCSTDNDCKGDRVCDAVTHACVPGPTSPDLGTRPGGGDLGGALPAGTFAWAKSFGAASTDQAFSAAADASGNVIVVGSFQGTMDLGGGPITSAGQSDIFVAKYSADGAYQWARRLGGLGDDQGYGVAVDPKGNIAVVGAFTGTTDLGGGDVASVGGYDVAVASYAADGTYRWAHGLGSTKDDAASSVAVDGSGDVVLTGFFGGPASFAGTALSNAGGMDVFLTRYSVDGQHLWSKAFGGTGDDMGNRVACDSSGNLGLTGYFHAKVNFGGTDLTSAGMGDLFVARYGPDGKHVWSKGFGGAADEAGTGVALDSTGATLVFGYYQSAVDLGGGPLPLSGPSGIFLAKLNGTGAHVWSKGFSGTAAGHPGAVATDGSGAVITGNFNDDLSLGGPQLTNGGVYVARYGGDGTHLWSRRFGGDSNSDASGVALDPTGAVVVAGDFTGSVDFGSGPLRSAGDYDGYLLKLAR